jgi:hypothetical protein
VVLVGMRRQLYVEDVLTELKRPVEQKDRRDSWVEFAPAVKELFA